VSLRFQPSAVPHLGHVHAADLALTATGFADVVADGPLVEDLREILAGCRG